MSKESKEKSLHERFKTWLKSDKRTSSAVKEIKISEDLKSSLGSNTSTLQRLQVMQDLIAIIPDRKLEEGGVEKIWNQVKDLLTVNTPSEHRHIVLHFLTVIATFHEKIGVMRHFFFNYISDNAQHEDIEPLFQFFKAITNDGKQIEYIDETIGHFYLNWLPTILLSKQSMDGVKLLTNLIKYNCAYLDETVVNGFIKEAVYLMMRSDSEEEIKLCLHSMDAVVAYSYLPSSAYSLYICALARIVSVPIFTEEAWRIMRNLYGTDLGNSAIYVTCRIIENAENFHMVRGCIFFLANALWGDQKIKFDFRPFAILPTLQRASESIHVLVIYETAISIQRLVSKLHSDLYLSTWNTVLQIIDKLFQFAVAYEDREQGQVICNVLNDTLDEADRLITMQQFYGSPDAFFNLVEKYSTWRQENSVIKVIKKRSDVITPSHAHWLSHLGTLMIRYFKEDNRTKIRVTALEKVKDIFSLHMIEYGTEMVEKVILTQLEGIQFDPDVLVRKEAVKLLLYMATYLQTPVVTSILKLIEKVVIKPYQGDEKVLSEEEAADVIEGVTGLVKLFKWKIMCLPSSHAIQAYHILMLSVELHYRDSNPRILKDVPAIRRTIFELIFELRADENFHLGVPNCSDYIPWANESTDKETLQLLPKYSPYIIVDHKHGQKPEESPLLGHFDEECDPANEIISVKMTYSTQGQEETNIQHETNDASKAAGDDSFEELANSPTLSPRQNENLESSVEFLEGEEMSDIREVQVIHLSLTQAATVVILSLKAEKDWGLLKVILERVPHVLQNKALILSRERNDIDYFALALCKMIDSTLPETLYNTNKGKLTASEFQSYVFPVLATLTSYHMFLGSLYKRNVILTLNSGIFSMSVAFCVRSLTLCVLEMKDTMVKVLKDVMLNVSKISATVQNARPVLEFLSTLLHQPQVYANFMSQEYIMVFAITIPYTSLKFNHYIISLAYHVIFMWFLKCRLPYRKHFVSFISKNLHSVLLHEERERRSSNSEQQNPSNTDRLQFHNDLREICIDLMSRYTFSSYSSKPNRFPVSEMLIKGGQSQSWLIGSKIITITTSSCSQRPLKRGVCEKCFSLCDLDNSGSENDVFPQPQVNVPSQRRRHRSEVPRLIPHESKNQPRSKDDLHMRVAWENKPFHSTYGRSNTTLPSRNSVVSPSLSPGLIHSTTSSTTASTVALDQLDEGLPFGAPSFSTLKEGQPLGEKNDPHLCACWCLGWAEVHIRQPTGDISYMMKVQNNQTLFSDEPDIPIHELSALFSIPTYSSFPPDSSLLDYSNLEYERCGGEGHGPRTGSVVSLRSDSVVSTKEWNSSASIPSSGPASHTSSETKLQDQAGESESDESRIPVQRCHSSPEMSDGVENKSTPIKHDESTNDEEREERTSSDRRESGERRESGDSRPSPRSSLDPASPSSVDSSQTHESDKHILGAVSTSASLGSMSSPMCSNTVSNVKGHLPLLRPSSSEANSLPPDGTEDNIAEDGSLKPMKRGRGHTISDMNPSSRIQRVQPVRKPHFTTSSSSSSSTQTSRDFKGGISPCSLFLQLFYHLGFSGLCERPLRLPMNIMKIKRAVNVVDMIQPLENHKIGVLYVGRDQRTEQEILSNQFGSYRYTLFVQGLGKCIELGTEETKEMFLGGLCEKGSDGKNVYIWEDHIVHVVYHIATLMPNKETDPNCNNKKRHIGNNFVTIVYNDTGKPYNINTLTSQFNHFVVEIRPGDHNTNNVGILNKAEMTEFVGENGEPRLVSDANLAILVRQLALHADMASSVWQWLKSPNSPYACNWLERLRKIRALKEKVLEVTDEKPPPQSSLDFTDVIDMMSNKDKGRSSQVYKS